MAVAEIAGPSSDYTGAVGVSTTIQLTSLALKKQNLAHIRPPGWSNPVPEYA
jgi:hypothetical protein